MCLIMKTASVLVVAILSSFSLFAGATPRHHGVLRTVTVTSCVSQPADPQLVASLFAMRAQTIGDNRSARYFWIPAAGSLQGANGTFFHSDVTLVNYGSASRDVLAQFWPVGQSTPPITSPGVRLTLPAGQAVTYVDFVATQLNRSGLGAILIVPVRGTAVDLTGAIDGLSRIYTKQPGSEGTVSQEFAPVDVDNLLVADESAALGMRQDAGYRTNFGILNADPVAHTVRVTAVGERLTNQTTVTVPAFAMLQTNIPAGDYGALSVVFDITNSGGASVSWVAYASSTDNITGDGWVSIASADLTPSDLTFVGYGR
jgi:hypothetical protein